MLTKLFNKLRGRKEFKEYSFETQDFDLPVDGKVQYAQWLHPGEHGNIVTQEIVDYYKKFIKPGDFTIDIGANEGDTSVPMALAAGKEGLTLALEPNPHVYKVLVANAGLNKSKTNIVPLNFAATAYDGEFTFGSGDASFGNGGIVGFTHNDSRNVRYTFQVTGKNLETYLRQNYADHLSKLTFIKVDAEGYDKEIIKTLKGIIKQYRPVLVAECFGPATTKEKHELLALLKELGYSMIIRQDFMKSIRTPVTPEIMIGKRTFDMICEPV
jgi:FkbM family methyltransferase